MFQLTNESLIAWSRVIAAFFLFVGFWFGVRAAWSLLDERKDRKRVRRFLARRELVASARETLSENAYRFVRLEGSKIFRVRDALSLHEFESEKQRAWNALTEAERVEVNQYKARFLERDVSRRG